MLSTLKKLKKTYGNKTLDEVIEILEKIEKEKPKYAYHIWEGSVRDFYICSNKESLDMPYYETKDEADKAIDTFIEEDKKNGIISIKLEPTLRT